MGNRLGVDHGNISTLLGKVMTQTIFDGSLLENNLGEEKAVNIVIQGMGEDSIAVENDAFITNSDIGQDGMNLVLTLDDGSSLTVENYFTMAEPPTLISDTGKALNPSLVESFARDVHGIQYADSSSSMTDASPVGAIDEISGDVTITRTNGAVETAELGSAIFEGDVIETSEDGAANIVFIDESSMAVSEDARLAIDEYVFDPSTLDGSTDFSILQGIFVYTSGIVGREDPDDVTIDTPVGSIGIRGTIIAGDINGSGEESQITVVEGAIVIRNDVSEITLSQQYETVRIGGIAQDIQPSNVLEAEAVQQSYNAVSHVAPSVFTSVQDNMKAPQGDAQPVEGQQHTEGQASDAQPTTEGEPKAIDGERPPLQTQEEPKDQMQREGEAKEDGTTLDGAQENVDEQQQLDQQEQEFKEIQNQQQDEFKTQIELDGKAQTLLQEPTQTALDSDAEGAQVTAEPLVLFETSGDKVLAETQADVKLNLATEDKVVYHAPEAIANLYSAPIASPNHVINLVGGPMVSGPAQVAGGVDIYGVTMVGDQVLFTAEVFTSTMASYVHTNLGTALQTFSFSDDENHVSTSFVGDMNNDGDVNFVVADRADGGIGQTNILDATGSAEITYTNGGNFLNGEFITGIGDTDGDGFDDYIYSSNDLSFTYDYISLVDGGDSLINSTGHATLHTLAFGSIRGLAGIGDFNGNGQDDYAVRLDNTVRIYENGSLIDSISGLDTVASGTRIEGIGDFNGDGIDDFIVQNDAQRAYVIYGGTGSFNAGDLDGAADANGMVINTARPIYSFDNVGDFNGDGYNDFAITTSNGSDYRINIIYGAPSDAAHHESQPAYNLGDILNSSEAGFVIEHSTGAADSLLISGGGDINGDGMSDIAVVDQVTDQAYYVRGRDLNGEAVTLAGDNSSAANNGDVLRGNGVANTLNGGMHEDLVLIGGDGDDTMILDASSGTLSHLKIDGGAGTNDRLEINNGTGLDFSQIDNLSNIDRIVLGTGTQTLTLSAEDIFDMQGEHYTFGSGDSYAIFINGAGDNVAGLGAAGFTDTNFQAISGGATTYYHSDLLTYSGYTNANGTHTVFLEQGGVTAL